MDWEKLVRFYLFRQSSQISPLSKPFFAFPSALMPGEPRGFNKNGNVTLAYKSRDSGQTKQTTIDASSLYAAFCCVCCPKALCESGRDFRDAPQIIRFSDRLVGTYVLRGVPPPDFSRVLSKNKGGKNEWFNAIDFETANPKRVSACALAYAKVCNCSNGGRTKLTIEIH